MLWANGAAARALKQGVRAFLAKRDAAGMKTCGMAAANARLKRAAGIAPARTFVAPLHLLHLVTVVGGRACDCRRDRWAEGVKACQQWRGDMKM